MEIESRLTDNMQLQMSSGDASSVVSRRKLVASDPSGDTSRVPVTSGRTDSQGGKSNGSLKASAQFIDTKKAVEMLSEMVQSQQTDVSFSVNKEADATVIKVTKADTGELIKQFPPEEVLAMMIRFRKNTGWLVDEKA